MSRLLIVLIIVIIVIIVYSIPVHKEPSLKISISEARSRRFGLIIDVRTPKERDQLGYY